MKIPTSNGRKALLTGITGQDGSYLAEFLLAKGYEVWGLVRRSSTENTSRIAHLMGHDLSSRLHLCQGDLADTPSIYHALDQARPDEVYNLAAQSHVHVSFECPEYTAEVTGLGTLRILDAIRQLGLKTRFYQASSSELFGKVVETPQKETTPFHPRSPYGCAKAFAFEITRNYRESYGLFAVNGILFNHESPRRGEMFVTRKITKAVAELKHGRTEPLTLGNLDSRRDWGFAGDFVEAMWLMLQADQPEDFVIATGETHTVREFCELAFKRAGWPLKWTGTGIDEKGLGPQGQLLVEISPQFFRPAEVDLLLGDASKAHAQLGWKPKVSFRELVEMMTDADLKSATKNA